MIDYKIKIHCNQYSIKIITIKTARFFTAGKAILYLKYFYTNFATQEYCNW